MYEISEFTIFEMYKTLRRSFGYLDWWPGESEDEIVIGAILTQRTSWKNVELALDALKNKNMLDIRRMSCADVLEIEEAIKPSGFYRQKAIKLKNISSYIIDRYGSLTRLFNKDLEELREELLSINGIGMETADAILLYAANKRIFVIDAYTKRIMNRMYGIDSRIKYEDLQKIMENGTKRDIQVYKEFHAQFVELGKRNCRKQPLCRGCPLEKWCGFRHSVEGTR